MDKTTEAVARAISKSCWQSLVDTGKHTEPPNDWENFVGEAEAAISAHKATLAEQGMVVVPRELNEKMMQAPEHSSGSESDRQAITKVWQAMIQAVEPIEGNHG